MLWVWLKALLLFKAAALEREARGGRPAAATGDVPWSGRKKAFGCLWMLAVVVGSWIAVSMAVFAVGMALEGRYPKDELGENLLIAQLIGMGLALVFGMAFVYSAADKGTLPGTKDLDPAAKLPQNGNGKDRR